MRRWLGLAAVMLVLGSACNQSQVAADADVAVAGSVQRQDGSPVDGTRVALMKEADAGEIFTATISIGLSCIEAEGDLSECGETRTTTTGPEGGFDFALKGRDTQGFGGNASIMELTTSLERAEGELAGPGVSTRFQVQSERVAVPLRAWEPALELEGRGAQVEARWTEPPPALFPSQADLSRLRRWVVFDQGDVQVWRADASGPGSLTLDARILEDTRGAVAAWATVEDIPAGPEAGTDVEVLLRSGRFGYRSPAGAPPSRGKPCSVTAPSGEELPQAGCPLTDGSYEREFTPATCPPDDDTCAEVHRNDATIDLGAPTDVTFVVVRGCGTPCSAQVSDDRSSWRLVGTAGEGDTVGPRDVAIGGAARGRFVRISSGDGIEMLREVSVWDAREVQASGSLIVTPEEVSDVAAPARDGGGPGAGDWLPWLALGALVVAVAGLLYLRRRRAVSAA